MQRKSFCNTEKYKYSYTSVLVPRTIVSGFCFDFEKSPISQGSCSRPHTGKIMCFSGHCIIRKDFSFQDRKGLFKIGKRVQLGRMKSQEAGEIGYNCMRTIWSSCLNSCQGIRKDSFYFFISLGKTQGLKEKIK